MSLWVCKSKHRLYEWFILFNCVNVGFETLDVETLTQFLVGWETGGVSTTILGMFRICVLSIADGGRFCSSGVFIVSGLDDFEESVMDDDGVLEDGASVHPDISEDEKSEDSEVRESEVVDGGEKSEDSEVVDFESSEAERSKLFVV